MDLSFSGAGFMGCYYFGVVNCWNKYIPRERVRRVAGASAGSLIAAYYLMDLPLDDCLKEIIDMTEDIRKRALGVFDRSNQIVDLLPEKLDKMFPDDAHKRVNGRLYVCMTRLKDMKAVVVNEFATKKDLIDALNCSCFIPVWSGNHVSTYKGVKHIDGGFRNNLPVFDEQTIRICCFAGQSDIAPYDRAHLERLSGSFQGMPFYLTWNNMGRLGRALWPPPASYIIELLERGFQDTKDFILSNDLIQCDKCFGQLEQSHQPIYTRLQNPTISPAPSPALSRAPSFMDLKGAAASLEPGARRSEGSFRRLNKQQQATVARLAGKEMRLFLEENEIGAASEQQVAKKGTSKRSSSRRRDASFCSSTSGESADSANSTGSSGIFSNNEDSVSQLALSGGGGDKNKTTKSVSFSAALRARLNALAPASKSSRSQPARGKRGNEVALDRSQAPAIVVHEAGAEREEQQQQQQQEQELSEIAPERKTSTISELMEEQDKELSFLLASSCSRSSGCSSPDQGEQQQPQQQQTAEPSSSSPVPARLKLRRGSEQKPATLANGTSPIDKFVRRMSVSPEQASKTSLTAEGSQEGVSNNNNGNNNNHNNSKNHLQLRLLCAEPPSRFAMASSPLPSCPPSPNLNRHCDECIRMRQEARVDLIDEQIKRQAELYKNMSLSSDELEREFAALAAGGGLKSRLSGWMRSLAGQKSKYAYTFEENCRREQPSEIPSLL